MYCLWPPEGIQQKSCDHCTAQKIPCMVDSIWVSNWKHQSRPEGSWPWKRSRVEVEESELESDGSREDGWRAWGLQAIAFGLLGLKESDRERNELLREQNSYLHRIAEWLENDLGPEEVEVLDSTIRE